MPADRPACQSFLIQHGKTPPHHTEEKTQKLESVKWLLCSGLPHPGRTRWQLAMHTIIMESRHEMEKWVFLCKRQHSGLTAG